ncbi:MAG: hypothetical protein GXO34_08760 [Deltaproteobacteria bacterium]|nr:hypothetical protein [Deltaproteobacteria bacterium]
MSATLGISADKPAEPIKNSYNINCIKVIDRDERGLPLSYPSALFYDALMDEVFVVCGGIRQLVIYTSDFYPLVSAGRGRGIDAVRSCSTSPDAILVCSKIETGEPEAPRRDVVQILDRALLPVDLVEFRGFSGAENFQPIRAQLRDRQLYVIGEGHDGVIVTDPSGEFVKKITPTLKVLGIAEKAFLRSFTFDHDGNLFLLSEELGKVFVFSPQGKLLYKFGEKGGTVGKLSRPRGIAINRELELVFVVDYMRHAINVYSIKGDYLFELGGMGNARGWLHFPSDVCVDRLGRLWVADTFNQRLQIFVISRPTPDETPATIEIRTNPDQELEDDKNPNQNFPTTNPGIEENSLEE